MILLCPICGVPQPDVGTMAAHLAEVHLLAPSEAMRRAREVREMSPTPKEVQPMAVEDGVKVCSFCKRQGHSYSTCAQAAVHRARKKREPSPKASASVNGFAGALAALRIERTELDAAIAVLERLEAWGR